MDRIAILLEVRSGGGAIGLGEAAPLPGMSRDTIEDSERALAAFARHAPLDVVVRDPISLGAQAEPRGADAAGAIDPCVPFELADPDAARTFAAAPPATRFAIETALL